MNDFGHVNNAFNYVPSEGNAKVYSYGHRTSFQSGNVLPTISGGLPFKVRVQISIPDFTCR